MNVDLALRFVLPYLDISGYSSALNICQCALALRDVVKPPAVFQWMNLDDAAPKPRLRLQLALGLDICAGEHGLTNIQKGFAMQHYGALYYYAGSVANTWSHYKSFCCLLSFTRYPCIHFQRLSAPVSLLQAVSMLVGIFEDMCTRPLTVRPVETKANAPVTTATAVRPDTLLSVTAFVEFVAFAFISSLSPPQDRHRAYERRCERVALRRVA